MQNIIIIGAGGCGRETFQWILDINNIKPNTWRIKCILDDDPMVDNDMSLRGIEVFPVDDYVIQEDDRFVCCIGDSTTRKRLVERLKKKGAVFTSVIHPTAVIADSAFIAEGVVLYPFSIVSDNAIINEGCIINMYSSVAHDAKVGSYCTISAHCDITGGCSLGNNVFMGTSSCLIPRIKIGNDSFICAGSVVMNNIRENTKVLGNPAKTIKI